MATVSAEVPREDVRTETDRIAVLEAELKRSEQRREAAIAWGEFLERELEARERTLENVIVQYEAQLEEAKSRSQPRPAGFWARVKSWL